MTRYLFGFLSVVALGVMPLVGCSEDGGAGGSGGSGGTGGTDLCEGVECDDGNACTQDVCDPADGLCDYAYAPVVDGTVCGDDAGTCQQGSCQVACTEQGMRDAIAAGGGPFTFDCEGPTTVVTAAEIVIDNYVILDGEGKLTVDGNESHRVFSVPYGETVELRGFTVTGGSSTAVDILGGGISNVGTLTLNSSTLVGNTAVFGGGISNIGTLTLTDSTVSQNEATLTPGNSTAGGGGISNAGTLTLINSTVSGNSASTGGGIWNGIGTLTLISSTVASNTAGFGSGISAYTEGALTLTNTLVDNGCEGKTPTSGGGNIESPGDSCGFDQLTDHVNVSAEQLKLGPLRDNGGRTMTHALLPGSVAIDVIPDAMCEVDTDQRGEPRPETGGTLCDVGAFEVQP